MSNLTPTPIVDKNGKKTTVHKKPLDATSESRVPVSTSSSAKMEAIQNVVAQIQRTNGRYGRNDQSDSLVEAAKLIVSLPAATDWEEVAAETLADAKKLGYNKASWNTRVRDAKQAYSEFVPTEGVNLLELDDKDTSLPIQDRYKVFIAKGVAKAGTPMNRELENDIYGWTDHKAAEHFDGRQGNACEIAEVTSVVEDKWSTFGDTFSGNDDSHGVQCEVQCACGWYKGPVREEGTLEEMIGTIRRDISSEDVFDGKTSRVW
jgi:hypothetical protein